MDCEVKLGTCEGLHGLMHEGRANNGQDCVIMHELKASALSAIETVIGFAQVH